MSNEKNYYVGGCFNCCRLSLKILLHDKAPLRKQGARCIASWMRKGFAKKLNKISGRRIALAHSLTTSVILGILNMFSVIALAARHGRLCFMCHIQPLTPSEYDGSPQGNCRGLTSYK